MKVSLVRRRAVASALLFSTLFVASVAAAPQASAITNSERHMASLINQARHQYGRSSLHLSVSLSKFARLHSAAMSLKRTIYHTTNLAYKLRYYSWRVAGENVGMGPSVDALHQAFMASPHHRYNNLYRGFTRVGIGIVYRGGVVYVTVIFLG